MTLTKNKMVREIGRRTRLKNHDVEAMLDALVEVWTEELINGGRIELENFLVLEVQEIDRGEQPGWLVQNGKQRPAPQKITRLVVRPSKKMRSILTKLTLT
ncbi:MAG: HU family DNA-binding protein [Anaerolineae bacterium]